eukprot:TRINITY_DN2258_c0_g1_i6.p1 TRINITY_DN2258_c0_g1~~TRINITY_DN2258_c0_g1_i6.p1  ORF type:complete len:277 (+),score=37.00 TRINITY_DN2258_c0_g1_i6:191-1021(+)
MSTATATETMTTALVQPWEKLQNDLLYAGVIFIGYFVLNRLMIAIGWMKNDPTGRYLAIHVVCNFYVVAVHLDDVFATYWDPANAVRGFCDTRGTMAILALHLFHIAFFRPLPMVDWIHHGVMIIVMLPLAYSLHPGPLLGHGAFFSSGLPGGIDYVMLVMVKNGLMQSLTEKRINTSIQMWIRCPGCIIHSVLTWTSYCETYKREQLGERDLLPGTLLPDSTKAFFIPVFVVMVTFLWNGIYFLERVVSNYAVKEFEMKQKLVRTIKPQASEKAQ